MRGVVRAIVRYVMPLLLLPVLTTFTFTHPPDSTLRLVATFSPDTTWRSVIADYDGDGDPDLLLNHHTHPPQMLRNDGGTWTEVPIPWGPKDRHDCAWGDANGDGLLDLFCAAGARGGHGADANELWMQHAEGTWTEEAGARGLALPEMRSHTAGWFDADGDGDWDLFIGARRREGQPDRLMLNNGGRFTALPIEHSGDTTDVAILHGDLVIVAGDALSYHDGVLSLLVPGHWLEADVLDDRLLLVGDAVWVDGRVTGVAARDGAWLDDGSVYLVGEGPDAVLRAGHLFSVPATAAWIGGESVAAAHGWIIVGYGYEKRTGPQALLVR